MNDQLKALAEKVNIELFGDEGVECNQGQLEAFAELVVQECCSIINQQLQHNNPNDCLLVLDIKDHFGVE